MKRLISWVLTLVLILGMVPAIGLTAGAQSYTVVDKVPATLDTSAPANAYGATAKAWVPMFPTGEPDSGTWCAWSADNYAEIVADGYKDTGSLHMVSASGKNSGVAFNAGLTVGETYTIGMWVKGTSNSGQVLISYGNGDFVIIGAAEELGADWTYYEATFTANISQINLNARDWGNTDIYIDNITIKNASGVDMLSGYGDFYTYGDVTKDSDVTGELTDTALLNTAASVDAYGATEKIWVPMFPTGTPEGTWGAWNDTHSASIVSDGYLDAGSLHITSAAGANTGIAIGGLTSGQQYTLSLWAKGTAQSQNLFSYGNGDFAIAEAADISSQWKQFTVTFTANMNQLNLCCRDWGTNDIYVDNITLTDASGNNILGCAGNFCHKAVVKAAVAPTCITPGLTEGKVCSLCDKIYIAQTEIAALGHSYGETGANGHAHCANCGAAKLWADMSALDISKTCASYGGAIAGTWVTMYEIGEPSGTYPLWSSDRPYGEIVADGHNDPGALHLASDAAKNAAVAIKVDMVEGQQYTLGLWAKGTSNSGSVLFSYGNGDVSIIAGSENLGADWTYYEVTITANRNLLNLVARDWGTTDIYIDNITLKDSNGVDLLSGSGDFCTDIDPNVVAVADKLDTSKSVSAYNATEKLWLPMFPTGAADDSGTWCSWSDANYAEIVAEGHNDVGSLHMVSASGKNSGVAFNAGLTVGEAYTIGMWVKGTSNSGQVLISYGNGDFVIIGAAEELGADWTYYEATFTANISQINLNARDWGNTDIYIDNITIKNASGVDLLAGYGDFCTYEVPVSANLATIDSENAYPWYGGAPTDKWAKVFETGTAGGTWPEWSSDRPYGEIVAEGNMDAGSLHLASDAGKNAAVGIGVNMIAGQTYTLGLWAKGTSNSGNVLISFGNGDASIIGASSELSAEWTYYESSFVANVQQLTLNARDWGTTDIYIDNVTLKNADGVDLLSGYGDFCIVENTDTPNVPVDDVVSGTPDVLDTDKHAWDNMAHMDAWTPFFPAGINADTNWNAWDSANYAEIAAIGKSDAGSLHIVGNGSNVGVALEAGLIPGNTYVLKAFVKGYTQNVQGGLQMYGNGDGFVAKIGYHQQVENNANWTAVTHTFVATRTALQLIVPGSTGVADIYLDDLQILDTNGNNILGNKGNFSVVAESIPDLAVISSEIERSYRWYWNAAGLGNVTLNPTVDNNVEIISEGCKDPGALYLWQNTALQDTLLTLVTSQAKDLTNGETYTLTMNVKGIFGYAELLSVFPAYLTQDQAKEQMNIPQKLKEVLGITSGDGDILVVPEWTTISFELPYNDGENGFTYLNLFMSRYTWGTHCYIDNIQVLDPDGNDVLGGAGNFMDSGSESYPIRLVKPEVEVQNSNTMYYMGYFDNATVNVKNHEEKVLLSTYTFGDQNFAVTHNGTTQAASDKNVTMNMASAKDGMPVIFSITSTKGIMEEDQSRVDEINIYDVTFSNYDNSIEALTLGQQELGFAWGDADGYSYTYTAPAKGILSVNVESGNVSVLLNGASVSSLELNDGDAVTVQIIPNQNANGGYVATDAVINSTWESLVPTIDSASLVLGDILNLNVKTSNADGCTLRVTVGSDVQSLSAVNGVYTVVVPAHRLYETVTLELLNADAVVATETWTMTAYAAALRTEYGADEKMMALLSALENYGTYAAYYANPTETAPSIAAVEAVTREDLSAYKLSVTTKDSAGLQPVISLYLDDACDIHVKLNAESLEGYTLMIDGAAVETVTQNGKAVAVISQILPQDWGKQRSIRVVDGDVTVYECSYSVLSYGYTALGQPTEAQPGLNGLLKAMFLYQQAADSYAE